GEASGRQLNYETIEQDAVWFAGGRRAACRLANEGNEGRETGKIIDGKMMGPDHSDAMRHRAAQPQSRSRREGVGVSERGVWRIRKILACHEQVGGLYPLRMNK